MRRPVLQTLAAVVVSTNTVTGLVIASCRNDHWGIISALCGPIGVFLLGYSIGDTATLNHSSEDE